MGESHRYYVRLKTKLLKQETKDFADNARLLDVGCGTGIAEEFLATDGHLLVALDLSSRMLQIAKDRCNTAVFICGDALNLPFTDATFDATFCFALMHHIHQDQRLRVMQEFARVTRPEGFVITFEHNPMNPLTRYIVSQSPVDHGVELLHLREMIKLHTECELLIVSVKYLVFFPRFLSFLEPLESFLHFIPLGGQYEVVSKKISS